MMLNARHDFESKMDKALFLSPFDQLRQSFFEASMSIQFRTRGLIMGGVLALTACPSDTASSSTESASSTFEATTGLIPGTDSHSNTSAPGATNETSSPTSTFQPETTTTATTTSVSEATSDLTTGVISTTGSPSSCDLEAFECFGTCKNDQCFCDNPCYAGGEKNCRDECAPGCVDQGTDPLHPDCVPENSDILPAPVIWTPSFAAKESEEPFFLEGTTHPETNLLEVSIDGSLPKAIEAPIFVPGMSYWGGESEHFVLPEYHGDFYNVCFTAVRNVLPSEKACVVVAGDPNEFLQNLRVLLKANF